MSTNLSDAAAPTLFTVGHSNHSMEKFVDLLNQHRIQVLVDIRSSPRSRYVPHFDRESLSSSIVNAGIKYLFLGEELGGRPVEPEFYDCDGRVFYALVAQSSRFLKGVERLESGIGRFRVAAMCSEEDPFVCHRHLLVARVLKERGTDTVHVRGNGKIMAATFSDNGHPEQRMLFDAPKEDEWKSLRSVLPKNRQPSFSRFFAETELND